MPFSSEEKRLFTECFGIYGDFFGRNKDNFGRNAENGCVVVIGIWRRIGLCRAYLRWYKVEILAPFSLKIIKRGIYALFFGCNGDYLGRLGNLCAYFRKKCQYFRKK